MSRGLNIRRCILDTNESIFDSDIARLATACSDIDVDNHSVDNGFTSHLDTRVFNVIANSDRYHRSSVWCDTNLISFEFYTGYMHKAYKLLDPAGLLESGHLASPDPRGTHMGNPLKLVIDAFSSSAVKNGRLL